MSDSTALIEKAVEIDPLNPNCHMWKTGNHYYAGKFDLAFESSSKVLKMIPDPPPVFLFFIALSCAYANRIEEADIYFNKLSESPIQDTWSNLGNFLRMALQGNKSKIHQLLDDETVKTAKRDFQYSMFFTAFYAKLDEKENALDWLENTVNRGFINYPFLSEYDHFLENIRGEERFKELMKSVKHEWENFSIED